MTTQLPSPLQEVPTREQSEEAILSFDKETIIVEDDERNSKRARTENDLQKEELARTSRMAKCKAEAVRIAEAMNLEKSLIDQTQATLSQICKEAQYNRDYPLIAASAIYITLRLNNQPFTLIDIANKVPCDIFSLGKVYTRVMTSNPDFNFNELDISLFVGKKCELLKLPETHQQVQIQKLALRVLNAIKDKDMLCGRRRETIAAAAIFLAVQALGLKHNIDTISKHLEVPKSTLGVRVREMKVVLMGLAKTNIPWANFALKDLHRYLVRVLDQLEILSRVVAFPPNVVIVADSDSDSEIELRTVPPIVPKTETFSPPGSPLVRSTARNPSTPPSSSPPLPSPSSSSSSSPSPSLSPSSPVPIPAPSSPTFSNENPFSNPTTFPPVYPKRKVRSTNE